MGYRDYRQTPAYTSQNLYCAYEAVIRTYLSYSILNNLLVRHIGLVADQQLVDALGRISIDLLQPLLHVVERIHIGDIVDDADTVGATVVRGGNGSESLLTGGIPLMS